MKLKEQAAFLQNPCEFDLKLNKRTIIGRRRHRGFPWFQAPLGQNFGRYRGRGKGRGGVSEELPRKSKPYHRSVKASFKVDLPELKFFYFNFLSHVSKK